MRPGVYRDAPSSHLPAPGLTILRVTKMDGGCEGAETLVASGISTT